MDSSVLDRAVDLLADNTSVPGRLVTSAAVVLVSVVVASVAARAVSRRSGDPYARYYSRKAVRYATAALTVVALAVVWRAFAWRVGVVLGLAAAGLAFAMQEVVGAFAGWVNILSGRIFRVGDRIQMAGVRGDVIDVTPFRTKIMEIGSAHEDGSWVRGRQHTGRIVAISNKATFTEPVYNYSGVFEFIWEELTLPVPYSADWHQAEQILHEEVVGVSSGAEAKAAMQAMTERYPVGRADVEPRVFARATDNWMELAARFVVPVRSARRVKDALTRSVMGRLEEQGIAVASETQDVTVHVADDGRG